MKEGEGKLWMSEKAECLGGEVRHRMAFFELNFAKGRNLLSILSMR